MRRNDTFVFLLMLLCAPLATINLADAASPRIIRNKGSDTMLEVASMWSSAYQAMVPESRTAVIEASGGGSGNGIAALINGHIQIANSSRAMKAREIKLANSRLRSQPVGFVVGWDALTTIVHPDNPIKALTGDALNRIYGKKGDIERWSDLGVTVPGCKDQRMTITSHRLNSGSYAYFRHAVLGSKALMRRDIHFQRNHAEMVDTVANDPCALGYISIAHLSDRIKPLCLTRLNKGQPPRSYCIDQQADQRVSVNYPLLHPLYMYTMGEPDPQIRAYLDWVRGADGQRMLKSHGFIPIGYGGSGQTF
ncbi:phosphate ABC transporter substrate-binding protein, PhoT family [Magnetococcus marinus MC-1]|uniref:Phosphate ABC transporter substrate-binding protein, PhoT family n=1 Tax=Magnetococcus marinus (strain ATCC BAA-1437 / JCM 17883 / MC-1) TaxID=156889 RepID=A0LCR3_MAGMM|nr:phosphate ABC transporter substrate-binding protein [Magnetococcus marinus]ABK45756.1 phosphate ABC transporter substrate-binding protein, PhoT family [Magnetococcus marinus MC-1]